MPTPPKVVSGASLRDVQVSLWNGSPTWVDVPASLEFTPATESDKVDQHGDDRYLRTFISNLRGSATIVSTMTALDILALVTGNSVSSPSATQYYSFMGTDLEDSPPFIRIRAKAKVMDDDSGSTTYGQWVWYHVYILKGQLSRPMGPPEMGNNKLMQRRIELSCYQSDKDESNGTITAPYAYAMFKEAISTTAIW